MKSDRPVFKRDTWFSAWLRDDDEAQIRMNAKVSTNLSTVLQKVALRQGRLTHISHIPAENVCLSPPPSLSNERTRTHSCTLSGVEQTQTTEERAARMKICIPTSGSSQGSPEELFPAAH